MIMSRKNRNGKRRNYTPKTYSRDFLTPTPIERAIQEVNKPASPAGCSRQRPHCLRR